MPPEPFDVTVTFTGLCLFHIQSKGQQMKIVRVLLVNANSGTPSDPADDCRGLGESILVRHNPHLRFRKRDWQEDGETEDKREKEWESRSLAGKRVTVGEEEKEVTVKYEKISRGHTRPNDSEEHQCEWIVDLHDILSKVGVKPELKEECLDLPLPNRAVTSRIYLGGGELKSDDVGRNGSGKPIAWYFRDRPGGSERTHIQALTERVQLKISGVKAPFQITLVDPVGTPETIKLAPPKGQDALEVFITNDPVDEVSTPSPLHLQHFRWFYGLLQNCPEKQPAPFSTEQPHRRKMGMPSESESGPLTPGNAFCPPASWHE